MKINLYKYVLLMLVFMLGYFLTNLIQMEANIIVSTIEGLDEYMADNRVFIYISTNLIFTCCLILIGVVVGLYFAEFGICKYIDNRRKIT